jgi:hypothetical protein
MEGGWTKVLSALQDRPPSIVFSFATALSGVVSTGR